MLVRSRPEFAISASATAMNCAREIPQMRSHHLGRVAGEVPAQDLEHAARVLERLVVLETRPQTMPAPVCSLNASVACSCTPAAEKRPRSPRNPQRPGRSVPVSGSKPENTPLERPRCRGTPRMTIVDAFV